MHMLLKIAAAALLALTAVTAPAAERIQTAEQLAAHLRTSTDSPLNALMPGPRERFIDGLVFGDHGVTSIDTADLTLLTKAQGHRLLSLFGLEQLADARNDSWASAPGAPEHPTDLELRFNRLNRHYRDDPTPLTTTLALLPELGEPSAVPHLSLYELGLLLRAAKLSDTGLLKNDKVMDTLQAALTRLAEHHPLQARDLASGYNLLLRGRRFGQAQTLLTHHDAGNTIPAVNFIPLANHERNALTAWRSVPNTMAIRAQHVGDEGIRGRAGTVTGHCHQRLPLLQRRGPRHRD